jgi:hypothetical protein
VRSGEGHELLSNVAHGRMHVSSRENGPVGFDNVVHVLRYGDSASDLQVVIMPAKEEIVAKVKNPVLCCGWRLGPGI